MRLKTRGVLGMDGNVRQDLNVVRLGQSVDSRAGLYNASASSERTDDIQKLTLEYLVETRRLVGLRAMRDGQ